MSDRKYGRITSERKEFPIDEPIFVLRGKDKLTPLAIRLYGAALKSAAFILKPHGFSQQATKLIEMAVECEREAQDVEIWQLSNSSKVRLPD
jgi:hypothetical protein